MAQGISGNLTAIAHYDVAVIGYGPTGAVLAKLLALCGLQVLVIEFIRCPGRCILMMKPCGSFKPLA